MREGAEEEDGGGGGGNPCRSSRKLWLNTHKIHHLSHFRAQFAGLLLFNQSEHRDMGGGQ